MRRRAARVRRASDTAQAPDSQLRVLTRYPPRQAAQNVVPLRDVRNIRVNYGRNYVVEQKSNPFAIILRIDVLPRKNRAPSLSSRRTSWA